MDRKVWGATAHSVAKSPTQLSYWAQQHHLQILLTLGHDGRANAFSPVTWSGNMVKRHRSCEYLEMTLFQIQKRNVSLRCLLVYLGCCNKQDCLDCLAYKTWTAWLTNKRNVFLIIMDQGTFRFTSGCLVRACFPVHELLSSSSHGGRGKEFPWGLF